MTERLIFVSITLNSVTVNSKMKIINFYQSNLPQIAPEFISEHANYQVCVCGCVGVWVWVEHAPDSLHKNVFLHPCLGHFYYDE